MFTIFVVTVSTIIIFITEPIPIDTFTTGTLVSPFSSTAVCRIIARFSIVLQSTLILYAVVGVVCGFTRSVTSLNPSSASLRTSAPVAPIAPKEFTLWLSPNSTRSHRVYRSPYLPSVVSVCRNLKSKSSPRMSTRPCKQCSFH